MFCYVPMTVKRLKSAHCVFLNSTSELSDVEAIRRFAFALSSGLEAESDFLSETTVAYAERYGGRGIGAHGGSGRSALLSSHQVKGIGPTPLVAPQKEDSDFWHTHGGMSLVDAIQEAVWSEFLRWALPYGSVASIAIITTGTQCWYEGVGGKRTRAPRAMVVREPAIRPAHFMRNLYFKTSNEWPPGADYERVRSAIADLHTVLPEDIGRNDVAASRRERPNLSSMVRRFATQSAAAQVRRFMHGAIGSSNIAIDGKWLDFGTASAFPTHANIKSPGAPSKFSTLWEEHRRHVPVIREMCTYVEKYLGASSQGVTSDAEELIALFYSRHAESLGQFATKLLGLPPALLPPEFPEVRRFGMILATAIQRGNSARIEPAISDLTAFGNCDAERLIWDLACMTAGIDVELSNRLLNWNSAFFRDAAAAYLALLDVVWRRSRELSISPKAVKTLLMIGALKANVTLPDLIRRNMRIDNENVVDNLEIDSLRINITNKINRVAFIAQTLFDQPSLNETKLFYDLVHRVDYSAICNQWLYIGPDGVSKWFPKLPRLSADQLPLTNLYPKSLIHQLYAIES